MATAPAPVTQLGPPLPDVELLEEDGIPLETSWHRDAMNLLIEVVRYHCRDRRNYFVGGNMFIYFNFQQARNRDFRGPDFFYVDEATSNEERLYWVVWEEEGKYPDVIIELSSPTTADEDHTTKKRIYERTFRTPFYAIYDPDNQRLQGWELAKVRYKALKPNKQGRLWCESLGLWLGTWTGAFQGQQGTWLRFFDRAGNVVPTFAEAEAQRAATAEAELAGLKALLAAKNSERTDGASG